MPIPNLNLFIYTQSTTNTDAETLFIFTLDPLYKLSTYIEAKYKKKHTQYFDGHNILFKLPKSILFFSWALDPHIAV